MRKEFCNYCAEMKNQVIVTKIQSTICSDCIVSMAKSAGVIKTSLTAADLEKEINQLKKDVADIQFREKVRSDLWSGKKTVPTIYEPIPYQVDETIPENEIHFKQEGKTVGIITNIGDDESPTVETPKADGFQTFHIGNEIVTEKVWNYYQKLLTDNNCWREKAEHWQRRCGELDNLNTLFEKSRDHWLDKWKVADSKLRYIKTLAQRYQSTMIDIGFSRIVRIITGEEKGGKG